MNNSIFSPRKITYIILFSLIFITFSCKVKHNTPLNQTPNIITLPNTIKVFVDQNGTFYPDNWKEKFGIPPKYGNMHPYSLKRIANYSKDKKEELLKYLNDSQNKKLEEIKLILSQKQRVFILTHGFNTSACDASVSFDKIKESIDYDTNKDEFIEFYWDGFYANNTIGSAKIWNNAAGYSQLAGEFGLRKVLNVINDKEIYIISHSRGASVVLSALSDPLYNSKFRKETYKFHEVSIGSELPLLEKNNKIKCILLAPAIGDIDFKTPNNSNHDESYRKFSQQVEKIHITINENDKTLEKYFKQLSSKFNPTDLGYNPSVFQCLSKNYTILDSIHYSSLHSHSFNKYIDDPKFKTLLNKNGIKTTN